MTAISTNRVRARGERFGWTLLPLALIGYLVGGLALLSVIVDVTFAFGAISSTEPIQLTLHATAQLPATPGTHHYFGSAYIADGSTVTATQMDARVSGVDALTRGLLKLGPLLWAVTICVSCTGAALALIRLRASDVGRLASRPLTIAAAALGIGSTAAQLVTAWADVRLSHIAWDGGHGIDSFTALPDTLFDITPLLITATMLAIVLLIRRTEPETRPLEAR